MAGFGLAGWRIGDLKNNLQDSVRTLHIHYKPDKSWDAQEPKKVSIEWEIIYGEQSLIDNFGLELFENNDLAQKAQWADRDDFNDINGVIEFDNSDIYQKTSYIKLPFPENELDYDEQFGVKLKNPSSGSSIWQGYYDGGSVLRKIPADSNSNLQIQAIPKLIEEGEKLEFYIESNATEEYFKDEMMRSRFTFNGMTNRNPPHGIDGMYVGKNDLTPNPILKYHEKNYHHSEVVQIPIKNGSTFSLPNYRAAKDSTKEGSELLEIRFDWGLGGMMQFPSQTVNLRINDKIKGNSKKNDDESQADLQLYKPNKFKVKANDKITNFNPSNDTLEIDTDSFGIDSSATFAAGKNNRAVKKKLARKDFDFLYDEKKGGLYFNENGADKGFGDGGIIAILKGAPDLTANNLEFI